jgi:hypothetical protein
MWSMLLIPLSIVLLVSAPIAFLRGGSRGKKVVSDPKGMKIYPTAISPLSRR